MDIPKPEVCLASGSFGSTHNTQTTMAADDNDAIKRYDDGDDYYYYYLLDFGITIIKHDAGTLLHRRPCGVTIASNLTLLWLCAFTSL